MHRSKGFGPFFLSPGLRSWAFYVLAQRQGKPIKKEQGAGRKVKRKRAQGAGQSLPACTVRKVN